MSTISNAVQVMVDNLVAKMGSNTPMTAEEQSMVAEAVALLSKSTTLEAALIVVAEQHLDAATTALGSATTSLQDNAEYLKLLPQISEIKTAFNQIKTGLDQTLGNLGAVMREGAPATPALDFSYHGPDIYAINQYERNSSTAPSLNNCPSTVVSLFDDDEKCFYLYFGYGSDPIANNGVYDSALKIDASGVKTMAHPRQTQTRISPSGYSSFLLIKTPKGVRLTQMTQTSLQFFAVMPSVTQISGEIPLSSGKFYQDPDSLNFWSYSDGRAQFSAWDEVTQRYQTAPDQTHDFLVEANFNDWAQQQGLTLFSDTMGAKGGVGLTTLAQYNADSSDYYSKNVIKSAASFTVSAGQYFQNAVGDTSFSPHQRGTYNQGMQYASYFEDQKAGHYLSFVGFGSVTSSIDTLRGFDVYYAPALLAVSPYHRVAVLAMAQGTLKSDYYDYFRDYRKTVLRAF